MKQPILCVEDDPAVQRILKRVLDSESRYQAVLAIDAADALAKLGIEPALLIIDVKLPDMDGFELCRKVRQQLPVTPILFLTGRSRAKFRAAALAAGANEFMEKPFDAGELLDAIDRLLSAAYA